MKLPRFRRTPMSDEPGVEIDEVFASLGDWVAWATARPSVFAASSADRIGARILAAGFVDPFTGMAVPPAAIEHRGADWREGLVANGLNSRMRAVISILSEAVAGRPAADVRIFAAEAVTPFALKLRSRFARFLGSEYGADDAARRALYPIAHEDLTALTLPSASFDIVTTNEVLEHVPDLDAALREIARVLKPGGWHIGTHPFCLMSEAGDLRARIVDGCVEHLKAPEYHGNPVDPAGGSLVFETPGWDIMGRAREAGFGRPGMRFLASERLGILTENTGVFVFCARK